MESSGGDTLAGDTVTIQVPADGPYGVNLRPDENGNAAVVHSFDKLPNGKFGPIQKHGGVHYGDVLFEINDINLSSVSHAEALQMLSSRNTLKKILKFQSPKVYYRKKNTLSTRALPQDGKNSFLSAVKRSRISDGPGSKKYIEYEIACQYRLVGYKVGTEVVYQWSVWKRYSEFEGLHSAIKKALGWQMDGIELPSAHTFVMNKMAPEFIDQRRDDLKEYWQKVIAIDKVMDFAKHHCSNDIKLFLQVEENTKNKDVAAAADMLTEDGDEDTVGAGPDAKRSSTNLSPTASGAPARRGSVRVNSRRMSTKTLGAVNAQLDIPAPPAATAYVPSSAAPVPSAGSTGSGPVAMAPAAATPAPAPAAASAPAPAAASVPPPPARPAAAATPAATVTPPKPAAAAPAPPPRPASAATAPAPPAASSIANLPPKTQARANLLGDIAKLRKD